MIEMFGEKLRTARKRAGISIKEIAHEVGLSRSSYNYYELGRNQPSLHILPDISRLLHISLDWLLNDMIPVYPIINRPMYDEPHPTKADNDRP